MHVLLQILQPGEQRSVGVAGISGRNPQTGWVNPDVTGIDVGITRLMAAICAMDSCGGRCSVVRW